MRIKEHGEQERTGISVFFTYVGNPGLAFRL